MTHVHAYLFSKHAYRAATPQGPWSPAGQFVLQNASCLVDESWNRERETRGIHCRKTLINVIYCGGEKLPDILSTWISTDIQIFI